MNNGGGGICLFYGVDGLCLNGFGVDRGSAPRSIWETPGRDCGEANGIETPSQALVD